MSKNVEIKKLIIKPDGLQKKSLLGLGNLGPKKITTTNTGGDSNKGSDSGKSKSNNKQKENN